MTGFRVLTTDSVLRGVGMADVKYGELVVTNRIYQPQAGEDVMDNFPKSLKLLSVSSFTDSRDIYTICTAASKISGGPWVLEFDEGDYFINDVRNYNTSPSYNWICYANGNRQVMGFVSRKGWTADGEFKTRIVTSPRMLADSPGAIDYAFNPASTTAPLAITTLYFDDGTAATTPLFFSGINYQGQDQVPTRAFGANAQTRLRRNTTAISPAPFNGINLLNSKPGSKFQYARLDAFSYALDNSPPYELGAIQSNRSIDLEYKGVELDGRLHSRWNAQRPRRGGGLMLNKETGLLETRTSIHHTRRSGSATNTNTLNTAEVYNFRNVVRTNIADVGEDGLPSDIITLPGSFNGFNIEGVLGLFDVRDSLVDCGAGDQFSWSVPYSNANGAVYTVPDHVTIRSWNNSTNETAYGGCLRIKPSKTPNSYGISPIWSALNSDFYGAASRLMDFRNYRGEVMTPVPASQFNALTHNRDKNYIIREF